MHEETDALLGEYGILKVTKEQYQALDKTFVMRRKKESFGYSLLTGQQTVLSGKRTADHPGERDYR